MHLRLEPADREFETPRSPRRDGARGPGRERQGARRGERAECSLQLHTQSFCTSLSRLPVPPADRRGYSMASRIISTYYYTI